jgi:hypothetical protein
LNTGFSGSDLDSQLAIGHPKNLTFAALTVLLNDYILSGKRGCGRKDRN